MYKANCSSKIQNRAASKVTGDEECSHNLSSLTESHADDMIKPSKLGTSHITSAYAFPGVQQGLDALQLKRAKAGCCHSGHCSECPLHTVFQTHCEPDKSLVDAVQTLHVSAQQNQYLEQMKPSNR